MSDWIIQGIGFVGLVMGLIVFQSNNRKIMLYLKSASSSLFVIHYFLMGSFTGSAMNAIQTARNLIYAHRTEKKWAKSILWLYGFILIFIVAGILTWEGYYSAFPMIAMILGSIAFWIKNTTIIRLISMTATPFWLAYNIIVGSYPGMITDSFIMISVIIGIIRFDILKQKG